MIDPNKVEQAVKEFLENETWKDIFMNAPGGAMERLAISFYFSKFHDQFSPEDFQEYREMRDEYENSLTEEDLNYLIENSEGDAALNHYKDLLGKVQGGRKPKEGMRFEKEQVSTQIEGDKGLETKQESSEIEEQEPTSNETPSPESNEEKKKPEDDQTEGIA